MTCRYGLTIENYATMSKACYDCPYNHTDCFRPHCISADGYEKTVIVANRRIPGMTIEVRFCFSKAFLILVVKLNRL